MRRVLIAVLGAAALSAVPSAAFGAATQPQDQGAVVLSGDVHVPAGETVESVVVFDGSVLVAGTVRGSVVTFSGSVRIADGGSVGRDVVIFDGQLMMHGGARVGNDVAVFDGLATIEDGARVEGDVYADHRAISPGAEIAGTTTSTARFAWGAEWAGVALWIGLWIAVAVSLLLLGLLFVWLAPRAGDAVARAGRRSIGPSIGWGAAMVFGLPAVAGLAMATVVGLPLGFALLLALGLIYALGTVAGMWFLGRSILRSGSRVGAFAIGWAIVTVVAFIPGLGALALLAVTWFGLGAMVVATYGARTGTGPAVELPDSIPSAPVSV